MSSSSSTASASLSSSPTPKRSNVKLPITSIPDMRFEQSYLASIRGFVHEVDEETAEVIKEDRQLDEERREGISTGNEKHAAPRVMASHSPRGEPELWVGRLRVQWWPLLYLTVRDQIFSPIIQGAIFGVGGIALTQLRAFLLARRQTAAATRGPAPRSFR